MCGLWQRRRAALHATNGCGAASTAEGKDRHETGTHEIPRDKCIQRASGAAARAHAGQQARGEAMARSEKARGGGQSYCTDAGGYKAEAPQKAGCVGRT